MTTTHAHGEPVSTESADLLTDQVELLRTAFPQAFTEGQVDFDKLRAALGDIVDDRAERYTFSWAGKRDAVRLLQTPTRATLVPCREESVDFDDTQHLFIEGDNLEVLKLLYRPYFGRVKMIYIDPPYNTGNDFIYQDDYTDPLAAYLQLTEQADAEGNLLTTNPETSGRYHSAWLSMMYPRLFLARQLLREDGVLWVSIGEQEVHNLRMLLNELFGEENFVATVVWQKSKRGDAKLIAGIHEYILVAAKNKAAAIESGVWRLKKPGVDDVLSHYRGLRKELQDDHEAISQSMREWYSSLPKSHPGRSHRHYYWSDCRGLYFADNFAGPDDGRTSRPRYDIIHPVTGKPCKKPRTGWRWEEARTKRALAEDPPLIHFGSDETTVPCRKTYLRETSYQPFASVFYRDGRAATLELEQLVGPSLMDFPKNTDIMRQIIGLVCDRDGIIMDFFAGSCATAQAIIELNQADGGDREFIMVQLPEPLSEPRELQNGQVLRTIADVGKQRLRSIIANMVEDGTHEVTHGFKAFKLAPSNFQLWAGTDQRQPDAYAEQLSLFTDPLAEGWTPQDVIYEIALKEGYDLNCSIEQIGTGHLYRVTDPDRDQSFIISLDEALDAETVQSLGLTKDDLFICRDVALTDDLAANLALQCRLNTI